MFSVMVIISGKALQTVTFPATKITSCCFGGSDYQDLYVTTSRRNLSAEIFQQQPLAGSVFKVTGLPVKGLPTAIYGA